MNPMKDGGPIGCNKDERFRTPNDVLVQCIAHVCGDAGVNTPTALPVI